MTYANQTDIQWLWEQIDDFFARLTEAGGSIQFDGEMLTLHAITGGQLGAGINLHGYFPKTNEAAGLLVRVTNTNTLQLKAVDGSNLGSPVDISDLTTYGTYLQLAGKRLSLMNTNGSALNYVDLP